MRRAALAAAAREGQGEERMRFASREWIEAVATALNAQPDLARAIEGLGRDAAFVVEAEPPAFPRAVAVHAEQARGRVARWRILPDEDDLLELEPDYVIPSVFNRDVAPAVAAAVAHAAEASGVARRHPTAAQALA